jgi:hypothetical protein
MRLAATSSVSSESLLAVFVAAVDAVIKPFGPPATSSSFTACLSLVVDSEIA